MASPNAPLNSASKTPCLRTTLPKRPSTSYDSDGPLRVSSMRFQPQTSYYGNTSGTTTSGHKAGVRLTSDMVREMERRIENCLKIRGIQEFNKNSIKGVHEIINQMIRLIDPQYMSGHSLADRFNQILHFLGYKLPQISPKTLEQPTTNHSWSLVASRLAILADTLSLDEQTRLLFLAPFPENAEFSITWEQPCSLIKRIVELGDEQKRCHYQIANSHQITLAGGGIEHDEILWKGLTQFVNEDECSISEMPQLRVGLSFMVGLAYRINLRKHGGGTNRQRLNNTPFSDKRIISTSNTHQSSNEDVINEEIDLLSKAYIKALNARVEMMEEELEMKENALQKILQEAQIAYSYKQEKKISFDKADQLILDANAISQHTGEIEREISEIKVETKQIENEIVKEEQQTRELKEEIARLEKQVSEQTVTHEDTRKLRHELEKQRQQSSKLTKDCEDLISQYNEVKKNAEKMCVSNAGSFWDALSILINDTDMTFEDSEDGEIKSIQSIIKKHLSSLPRIGQSGLGQRSGSMKNYNCDEYGNNSRSLVSLDYITQMNTTLQKKHGEFFVKLNDHLCVLSQEILGLKNNLQQEVSKLEQCCLAENSTFKSLKERIDNSRPQIEQTEQEVAEALEQYANLVTKSEEQEKLLRAKIEEHQQGCAHGVADANYEKLEGERRIEAEARQLELEREKAGSALKDKEKELKLREDELRQFYKQLLEQFTDKIGRLMKEKIENPKEEEKKGIDSLISEAKRRDDHRWGFNIEPINTNSISASDSNRMITTASSCITTSLKNSSSINNNQTGDEATFFNVDENSIENNNTSINKVFGIMSTSSSSSSSKDLLGPSIRSNNINGINLSKRYFKKKVAS